MRLARSQHVSRGKCSTYRSWSRTNHNNPFIVSFYIFTNRSPWPLHRHRAWQHSLKSVFHEVGPKSKSRLTKCVQHRNRHIRHKVHCRLIFYVRQHPPSYVNSIGFLLDCGSMWQLWPQAARKFIHSLSSEWSPLSQRLVAVQQIPDHHGIGEKRALSSETAHKMPYPQMPRLPSTISNKLTANCQWKAWRHDPDMLGGCYAPRLSKADVWRPP